MHSPIPPLHDFGSDAASSASRNSIVQMAMHAHAQPFIYRLHAFVFAVQTA